MNQKRDFEPVLLEELKYFYRCTQKAKNPNHFCSQSELAKNLQMSLRDVGRTLHEMTAKGLVTHDKSKQNGRLRDRFIPTNERLYESKQMIKDTEIIIQSQLDQMRRLAVKMRDRPAIKSINMLPVLDDPNNPKQVSKARSYQGNIDKIGHNHLDQFCSIVNNIFSYIDSMTYATYDDSIEANEKTDKIIKHLRIKTVNEITGVLEYIFKAQSARKSHALMEMIRSKIPTYFMLTQFQTMAKAKI